MSRKKHKGPQMAGDVAPNLVPMVDIMFLLLLFFILGADMSQREQADVILPNADMVQEEKEKKAGEDTTTINLQHLQDGGGFACPINKQGQVCRDKDHWEVVIRGRAFSWDTVEAQIKQEADESLDPEPDPVAGVVLSNRKVSIRADRTAPYGDVQRIIQFCSANRIYKIEVAAAKPPPD